MRTVRIAILTALFVLPLAAGAAETGFLGPIVPKCAYTPGVICTACDLIQLVNNILDFMVAIAVIVATAMFAYAGVLYVTASAAPKNIDSAKSIFSSVFIGLVLVLGAWLIVNLLLWTLTGVGLGDRTNLGTCPDYQITTVYQPDPAVSQEADEIAEEFAYEEFGLMTDAEARAYAKEIGLTVDPNISTLEGTAKQTLDNAKALQDACGCVVVITSTTGGTHSTRGDCTHGSGCKFDARSRDEGEALVLWIKDNLTPIAPRSNGDAQYRDGCGNVYAIETNTTQPHIDVSAGTKCGANLISTRG